MFLGGGGVKEKENVDFFHIYRKKSFLFFSIIFLFFITGM